MSQRSRRIAILLPLACATMLVFGPALAEGSLTGRVTSSDDAPLSDVRIVLIPEKPGEARRAVSTNKKGVYFFGLVPDGSYTLAVEGTPLVPHAIALVVQDTEKHQAILNVKGPSPSKPPVFDIGGKLKTTFDLVLGAADKTPAAIAAAEAAALQEVPALLQSGDYKGALERIDAALARSPGDSSLHYYKAFSLFRLKDHEHARPEVSRALEINPSQVGAHWVLGAMLASEGRKAEAVAEFRKELENPQTDPATRVNANVNIGLIERELGHTEAAVAAFEKVVELDSHQAEAYSYLAELYAASGKPEKAAAILGRSRELGVEDPRAVFNLGAEYWNKKEFEKAEERFRRAVDLDPKFALAWKNLGYALVRLGKTAEARTALDKYLELTPDAEDAKEVKQLLEALGKS